MTRPNRLTVHYGVGSTAVTFDGQTTNLSALPRDDRDRLVANTVRAVFGIFAYLPTGDRHHAAA